jgi:hypothetical protein
MDILINKSIKTETHFKLKAYIVSFEFDAPCGRQRNK